MSFKQISPAKNFLKYLYPNNNSYFEYVSSDTYCVSAFSAVRIYLWTWTYAELCNLEPVIIPKDVSRIKQMFIILKLLNRDVKNSFINTVINSRNRTSNLFSEILII
jgi:hypothetical protein